MEEEVHIVIESSDDPFCKEIYFLMQCLSCHNVLLGHTSSYVNEYNQIDWNTKAERLWPTSLLTDLSLGIPATARRDIKDAHKCFSHGIYSAAAVLCGRALERLIFIVPTVSAHRYTQVPRNGKTPSFRHGCRNPEPWTV
ncbi:MAG: hypothetical protein ACOYMG_23450, partial [Candidatus Methylumidiphilus sp.]